LAHPAVQAMITLSPAISRRELSAQTGGHAVSDLFTLVAMRTLIAHQEDVYTLVTSGSLPDADFRRRYRAMGEFTPEPLPVAVLAYQAGLVAAYLPHDRVQALNLLADGSTVGGIAAFQNGYWVQAPLNRLQIVQGELLPG
jgi:hypothetical protein